MFYNSLSLAINLLKPIKLHLLLSNREANNFFFPVVVKWALFDREDNTKGYSLTALKKMNQFCI